MDLESRESKALFRSCTDRCTDSNMYLCRPAGR